MNASDKERLEELKLKIFGHYAEKSLSGEDTYINSSQIESHGGRVKKAIRLLKDNGYIYCISTPKKETSSSSYYSPGNYYNIQKFEEESEPYGSLSEFKSKWEELIRDCQKDSESFEKLSFEKFEHIGFLCVADLSSAANIYIYHHKDDFLSGRYITVRGYFRTDKEDMQPAIYPKVLEEDRKKAILRSCVEIYFIEKYHNLLEKKLDLPEGLLTNNKDFDSESLVASVHTPVIYPETLQKIHFEGAGGFLEAYTHLTNYFSQMKDMVKRIISKVDELGGYDQVRRELRQEIIETLMLESPLYSTRKLDDPKSDGFEKHRIVSAKFFLKHAHLLNYDILYGTDESIKHYSGDSHSYGKEIIQENAFEPYEKSEKEVAFLKIMRGEQNKCLAKMISETLEPTLKSS